ncbi:MAG: DUF1972 domain-containing protein [Methyloversatilis sp.]|uniref:DUF1972 domain-containing protein n=1 Tax=Methyloversatilis sp. TaxID=2569862 RepID=UPI0027338AAC|nr:DUF1972 domain-containing protein [Methyloversatilis sp.]MDP2867926.1 DUF1972 domain-containing protein [Methyloversatilis sp.]
MKKVLRILGTRGVPAAHGGFETFAEYLARYLVTRGWQVIVYCQEDGAGPVVSDEWEGISRITIPVSKEGPKGTIIFDWKSTLHASKHSDLCLTLGYNTAVFCVLLRIKGVRNVINMDGIEWRRKKWGRIAKTWFWLNDWAGCWLGNHLVADHPEIASHLATRTSVAKISTISYGADKVDSGPVSTLSKFRLESRRFLTVIARAEPENSLLEIVAGFSEKHRGVKLVVLGKYDAASNDYHKSVLEAAGDEVIFVGAIYDKSVVQTLRYYSLAYVHGHQVGGTNPSLVEALGAGNAVLAHNNKFNRWVADDCALYFNGAQEFSKKLDELLSTDELAPRLGTLAAARFTKYFTWQKILGEYEQLLEKNLP